MATVTILGGCGAVGRVVAATLSDQPEFSEIRIADQNQEMGAELCNQLGEKTQFITFDATQSSSIRDAIAGSDLVINCVGPFYRYVLTIVDTVLDCKIPYLDVCDDVDVTQTLLSWSDRASNNNLTAIIGMGCSPGITNLLACYASEYLLDETESVDIFHAHGGEAFEGPGVIGHRFHCMSIPIPMYLNGKLEYVDCFTPDGEALQSKFDFPGLGNDIPVYPYPHPEQVTLPQSLTLRQVTNRGVVLPLDYYNLTRDLCRLGFNDKTPIDIDGQSISPYQFALGYILRERESILKRSEFGGPKGCVSVVVQGTKSGEALTYRFHLTSQSEALGEGTGIPAAMGALLMIRGKVTKTGILPPEAAIDPQDFLKLMPLVLGSARKSSGKGDFNGIIVERVDSKGQCSTMRL